ncbi:MAG: hypothetical protein IJ551_07505 [Prevotella sp.]|nr:hypothetical protein [Prevotella sp.]
MKNVLAYFVFVISCIGVVGQLRAQPSTRRSLKPASAPRQAEASSAYYFTPMGVTYVGLDRNEKSYEADCAMAPARTWLNTSAMVKGGSPVWTFPTGKDDDGQEIMKTLSQKELQFRNEAGLFSAPLLQSGTDEDAASYRLADDGIYYGQGYLADHYAVNFRPADMLGLYNLHDYFATNSTKANENMEYVEGGWYTDIVIHGFSESFYESGQYYLLGARAEVYCPDGLTAEDIEAHIYKKVQTSVKDEELAQLSVGEIHPVEGRTGRYMVTFNVDGVPPLVTTGAILTVTNRGGSEKHISPIVPGMGSYHSDNAGTASIYADFKLFGSQRYKQHLDVFGLEMNDDDEPDCYLANWNVGLRTTYDANEALGIATHTTLPRKPDTAVYALSGQKVAASADAQGQLPAGIYVICGKKVFVK